MKLRELCEKIEYTCLQGSMDVEIADIIYDSRKLEQGTAFVRPDRRCYPRGPHGRQH